MIIKNVPIEKLAAIVAGLVREGVGFEVKPADSISAGDYWNIHLTGGY